MYEPTTPAITAVVTPRRTDAQASTTISNAGLVSVAARLTCDRQYGPTRRAPTNVAGVTTPSLGRFA